MKDAAYYSLGNKKEKGVLVENTLGLFFTRQRVFYIIPATVYYTGFFVFFLVGIPGAQVALSAVSTSTKVRISFTRRASSPRMAMRSSSEMRFSRSARALKSRVIRSSS